MPSPTSPNLDNPGPREVSDPHDTSAAAGASEGRNVIAISGAIGSGKENLAKALSERLALPYVSFGKEVRRYAENNGLSTDLTSLQQLGQALVKDDLAGFVERVLTQFPVPNIVSGLRHVEVLLEMRKQLSPRIVTLVHINMPSYLREERLMARLDVNRRLVGRYDNDLSEAQVVRILPQYASVFIDGELPVDLQMSMLLTALPHFCKEPRS